jgi:hypothetical protein
MGEANRSAPTSTCQPPLLNELSPATMLRADAKKQRPGELNDGSETAMCLSTRQRSFAGQTAWFLLAEGDEDTVWDAASRPVRLKEDRDFARIAHWWPSLGGCSFGHGPFVEPFASGNCDQ